jgi:hypothetical protein
MKKRFGFVSNSSSSSFTCDICGCTESGYDACLRDFGMSECERGHTFCDKHKQDRSLSVEEKRTAIIRSGCWEDQQKERVRALSDEEMLDEFEDIDWEYLIQEYCPICQFICITPNDALQYLLHSTGKTQQQILSDIKQQFGDYDTFKKAISGK